jgi:quercetin dioxygenase-like cupin family protein
VQPSRTQPLRYGYALDLSRELEVPAKGILSRTLHQDEHGKAVLFGFAAGEELSEHTASVPATLLFLEGHARLVLGGEAREAGPGTWVSMPAGLGHAIRAVTSVRMLLVLQQPGSRMQRDVARGDRSVS